MEIYKTTNKITGEFYIGMNSTSNFKYLGSGVELQKQIDQYGKENFTKEILCVITSNFEDKDILRKIENIYIEFNKNDVNCLNVSSGYSKHNKDVKTVYKEKIVYVDKIVYKYKHDSFSLSKLLK
jgi:rRNA maturation protein Rpf1